LFTLGSFLKITEAANFFGLGTDVMILKMGETIDIFVSNCKNLITTLHFFAQNWQKSQKA
jgi:hypothetical protein